MITTIKFQNLKMLFILVDKTVAFQISRISEIVEKIERSLLYKIICVTSRGIQACQNTTRYKNSHFFMFFKNFSLVNDYAIPLVQQIMLQESSIITA